MATPPSSPPPPPPPPTETASQSSSTLKRTRKATRLRSLATRIVGADRSVVHVDPTIGKAEGPHKKKLKTYLGIVARDKVDMTYENWKQISASQKDLIWEDIWAEFDIPEASDVREKKENTSDCKGAFKSDLTSKWAFAADKDNVDDTVCKKYGISKEKWVQFCQSRRDPSWEDVRKKAQAIQKQNTAPHVLSCGGYEYLEKKSMVEKTKEKLEETAQSRSTEVVIDPLSPIKRHVKWKMARTKKTGKMTFEVAKEIVEKVDSLEEQACTDCCHWVTRTPWSCAYCWSRCDHQAILWTSSTDLPHFFLHGSRRTRAADSTDQGPAGGGLALPPEPEVGPSAACVSTKESCVDPSGNDPDTGDSDKCGLYIEENPPCLVALGKVNVEKVRDADALIPIPTKEVKLVGQTLNTFLAWLTHLVKRLLEQVMWDATVFGVFNEDFPLYIKHEDLSKIAHGGQCLSIFVIQLWILHLTETSMRVGNSDVYGLLEPQSIQRSGQSQFESESYMKNWMQNSKRDVYLGAYLNTLLSNINILMFLVFNSALKGLDNTPEPKSKAGARQKGSTECGYYVMHWMSTIILGSFRNNWETYFNESLKALRIQWAKYYLKVRNQT
ncbi:hypothetical protein HKD37_10G028627 [Glycine soja]